MSLPAFLLAPLTLDAVRGAVFEESVFASGDTLRHLRNLLEDEEELEFVQIMAETDGVRNLLQFRAWAKKRYRGK